MHTALLAETHLHDNMLDPLCCISQLWAPMQHSISRTLADGMQIAVLLLLLLLRWMWDDRTDIEG